MFVLAIGASIMVAIHVSASMGLRSADNLRAATDARLAAESGLAFTLRAIRSIRLPHDTTEATFLTNMRTALAEKLDGTANLAGQPVVNTGTSVSVPEVRLDDTRSFCAWIAWVGDDRCQLRVRGSAEGLVTDVAIELDVAPALPKVFDYGMASRGPLWVSGSAQIVGVNDASEGNIFSASDSVPDPIHIDGSNVTISGDIFVGQESGSVVIEGNPSIGGVTGPDSIAEHIHFGTEPPDFPELDIAPLAALATNVVDASTDTSAPGATYSNIRIAAGTNPVFASSATINGVVYVEAPNIVRFEGQATVNGFIVTQDNGSSIHDCQLHFSGAVSGAGVAALPDTAEFLPVKEHTGTFILAPGFQVSFAGGFDTINGSIAADQFSFMGNATGTIKGTVMTLADLPTEVVPNELGGQATLRIDRSDLDQSPAGFLKPLALQPVARSYRELIAATSEL